VHDVLLRQPLGRKDKNHYRDNDDPAADPEQPGKQPGDCTG